MSIQIVGLNEIHDNPFRHITEYRLNDQKVEELIESIRETGFWTNVCARPSNGHYEIAYGHHRIAAAKRVGLKEVPLVTEKGMDDARMFAMMLRENGDVFGSNVSVDANAIAGLLMGFVNGRLRPKIFVNRKAHAENMYLASAVNGKLQIIGSAGKEIRDAITKDVGVSTPTYANPCLFTTYTLAADLGWIIRSEGKNVDNAQPSTRFRTAFDALKDLIIPGTLEAAALDGLSQKQVASVVKATKAATTVGATPKQAAKEAIKEIKSDKRAKEEVKAATRAAKKAAPQKKKELPDLDWYAAQTIEIWNKKIDPYEQHFKRTARMLRFLDDLNKTRARQIAEAIRRSMKRTTARAESLALAFEQNDKQGIRALLTTSK